MEAGQPAGTSLELALLAGELRKLGCARRSRGRCVTQARSASEDHDPAGHLTAPQRGESLVDLRELIGPAHELVDLESAVEVEIDEPRKVDVRAHGAVHRAAERLFLERH